MKYACHFCKKNNWNIYEWECAICTSKLVFLSVTIYYILHFDIDAENIEKYTMFLTENIGYIYRDNFDLNR